VETEGDEREYVRGAYAGRNGRRRARVIEGERMCASEGCSTKLSRYNTRKLCWVHQPPTIVTRVEKRAKGQA
jgi:hypothetical protein